MMRWQVLACWFALVALTGCATPDSRQIAWHDRLTQSSGKVNDAQGSGQKLPAETVIQACGRPDVETTVQGLSEMLHDSPSSNAESALVNLYFAWCLSRNQPADELHTWQNDESFLTSQAWIYDERQHFKAPLPDSAGFDSFVFVISGDEAIASTVIIPSPVWNIETKQNTAPASQRSSRFSRQPVSASKQLAGAK